MSEQDQRGAATRLSARSFVNARRDPDESLDVDPDLPGYLKRIIKGRQVFVPAHLAPVFPGGALLDDVVDTAICLSLSYGHPICLSGSTTFLGRSRSVSDLDFCEYFMSAPAMIPAAVRAKVNMPKLGLLVRFKCDGETLQEPWDAFEALAEALLFRAPAAGQADRFKLDFIQQTKVLGLMPTTSVVLPIDETDPEALNARFSFAYQEAVITTGRPPRSLMSADRLARYLLWLRGDIRYWLESDQSSSNVVAPLKALKRTLSFLLMIGRDDLVDSCVEVLSCEEIADISLKARIDDLRSMLDSVSPNVKPRLEDDIKHLVTSLPHPLPTDTQCAEALRAAREEAEDLLNEIDEMFEAAA